jgi:hypothetical protein
LASLKWLFWPLFQASLAIPAWNLSATVADAWAAEAVAFVVALWCDGGEKLLEAAISTVFDQSSGL